MKPSNYHRIRAKILGRMAGKQKMLATNAWSDYERRKYTIKAVQLSGLATEHLRYMEAAIHQEAAAPYLEGCAILRKQAQ